MRIAYVYDAVYPWETGGVQKRVWELARRLAATHDVHWYGLHYWDGPAVIDREGVTLHGVMDPVELYVDGRRSIPEALAFAVRLLAPLLRADFDVVDCQQFPYFPCFPSKLQSLVRDGSLVLTWHEVWGDYWYDYLGRKGWFGRTVERTVAGLPDAHLAVSEGTRRDLAGLGVDTARVVPNGVDMAEIEAVAAADEEVDVLFVGRLIPEKNAALLVRAVEAAPDPLRCVIVGDGPQRAAIEGLVERRGLGDAVSVRDPLPEYADVIGLMKAADVFALPSRREGFGITVLEALATGTPVVTVAHPANAATELVDDGNTGVVCEPTPEAVAAALGEAAGMPAAGCVESARAYDWDRIAERLTGVYAEVA